MKNLLKINAMSVDLDSELGKKLLKTYNGFNYLSDDLDGAPIKIGTSVLKVNSEDGDITLNGTRGKVIGSISKMVEPEDAESEYCYTVVWDNKPSLPISTIGRKLQINHNIN